MIGHFLLVGQLIVSGSATAPPVAPAPERSPKAALGPGGAAWAGTFAEARERARQEGKVVYVEFGKDGCGDCERLKHLLYPAMEFELTLLRMVPVKLTLDAGEAVNLGLRYNVTQAPAVLIVSPGGALIFRLEGYETQGAFFSHVHQSMADYDRLNVKMVHEPETIADPRSELSLGAELFRRFDSEEALPRLERAARSPKADPETREEALAFLASAQLDLNRVAESRATVESLLKLTKNPVRREKAELFRAQVALAEGHRDEARRRYQDFLKKHPDSKLKPQAEAVLRELEHP